MTKRYEQQRAYYDKAPWARHRAWAQSRAKRNGWLFNLTTEEAKAAWERDGAIFQFAPSIDRIDPKLGYTAANVRFIEANLNKARGNLGRKATDKQREAARENMRATVNKTRCSDCNTWLKEYYIEREKAREAKQLSVSEAFEAGYQEGLAKQPPPNAPTSIVADIYQAGIIEGRKSQSKIDAIECVERQAPAIDAAILEGRRRAVEYIREKANSVFEDDSDFITHYKIPVSLLEAASQEI